MVLDHSKATAKISLTGLAISCFNASTNNWEVALIRHPLHQLKITVSKALPDMTRADLSFEVDEQHRIFITAANAITPEEPLFRRDPFNRQDRINSHQEDIRWIVDFEREFNGGKPINLTRPDFAITELFVSQPTLYADKDQILNELDLLKVGGITSQQSVPPQPFGDVSEICHADISCNKGGAVILRVEGPLGFSVELPHIEGATHGIRIENLCCQDNGTGGNPTTVSDFHLYFDLVKLPNGAEFDLKPRHRGQNGSDAVCNPGFLGSSTGILPIS